MQWKNFTGQNYCIDNTLANWKRVCETLKMDNECVLVREMAEDPDFIPNRTNKILKGWPKKGLTKYSQLITNHTNSYILQI